MSKNAKVEDVMTSKVMTLTPHQTAGHVRKVMVDTKATCFPVVDTEGTPVGIISAGDLIGHADGRKISEFMTDKVFTVPRYEDVMIAARIMRNHHIHHLVVTDEKVIVGILSSFDMLALIDGHKFQMKNAPTPKKGGKRRQAEA